MRQGHRRSARDQRVIADRQARMIQAFRGVFLTLVLVFLAPVQTQANSLDDLFAKLKAAPDEATAFQIERRIWETWTQPDDAALSKKMVDVISAMRTSNFEKALDLLMARNDVVFATSSQIGDWFVEADGTGGAEVM